MPRTGLALLLAAIFAAPAANGPKFYPDDPILREPAPRDAGELNSRKLSDLYDLFRNTLAQPGELAKNNGGPIPARNINTLGDPLEGAWWEKRHYFRPMSRERLKLGPGGHLPPSTKARWTVISAKSEGVTPGFAMTDEDGRTYFVKFDSRDFPELSTAADQISSKLFYALGYHVPDNYTVHFRPQQLQLGKNVRFTDERGRKRHMMPADLAALLRRAPHLHDGSIRATASLAVPGKPLGPYRYHGTRSDDPNDTVPHEHRRDLRGMRLAAAWIDHDDSRAINTYDALVEEKGVRFIRHYQLDFGSTLGSASYKPNSPRSGGEYLFSWKNATVNFVTFGLYVPAWARARYPDIPAVGRFESQRFDPAQWVPEYPNPAFSNSLPDDDFWMAKQIMALSDDDIEAIVSTGQYSDPGAGAYLTGCLAERRDKIGRYAFGRVLPLDRFAIRDGRLTWEDLSATHGFGGAGPVTVAWSRFDNTTSQRYPLPDARTPALPREMSDGYWVADLVQMRSQTHRVAVYFRKQGEHVEIAGIEHKW